MPVESTSPAIGAERVLTPRSPRVASCLGIGVAGSGQSERARILQRPVPERRERRDEDATMSTLDTPVFEERERASIEAAILDLDGVVTNTASVHQRAWARAFDTLLASEEDPRPFTRDDYMSYVDGKPRLDGVRSFLESRGITRPEGDPDDPPSYETIAGIGNLKDGFFHQLLAEEGVEVFDDAVRSLHAWRRAGLRTAIVSSSRNAAAVLKAGQVADLFEVRVDGEVGRARGLAGKPAPDYFLEAARELGVTPARSMVVEDAISGVTAGRRGAFGLVVGVSRDGGEDALLRAGADMVVRELTEIGERPRAAAKSTSQTRRKDET